MIIMTVICPCGCKKTHLVRSHHVVRKNFRGYIRGHYQPRYKGICFDSYSNRYVVYGRNGATTYWARIVAENTTGRLLKTNEHAHHINFNCLDDRPENIRVLTRKEHAKLHSELGWKKK